jgi:hypothetical protein
MGNEWPEKLQRFVVAFIDPRIGVCSNAVPRNTALASQPTGRYVQYALHGRK